MNLEIKSKLKRLAGFIAATIAVFTINYFLHIDFQSPMMAFLFIAVLFVAEYMYDNVVGYAHMVAVSFWVCHTFIRLEDSPVLFSLVLGLVAAFIPLAMHLRMKEKSKKPR